MPSSMLQERNTSKKQNGERKKTNGPTKISSLLLPNPPVAAAE
jgi:hypothetical protein